MNMYDAHGENVRTETREGTMPKTDEALLQALRAAASRRLTPDEIQRQRVSFVVSSLKNMNSISRERVRDMLEEQEGRKIAK
jgi:hypothetical protein